MEETKTCKVCNTELPLTNFYKDKTKKSGYRNNCKKCCKEYNFKYRIKNKEYFDNYRKDNVEYFTNKNKEHNNSKKYKKTKRDYIKNRRLSDPMFKLQGNLRNRVYIMFKFKDWKKSKKTEEMLGATYEEVKTHLESTFQEGMSWSNHGRCSEGDCSNVWHIDHKIPLSSATTKEELIKLCHYTNLQALWAIDNIIKSNN